MNFLTRKAVRLWQHQRHVISVFAQPRQLDVERRSRRRKGRRFSTVKEEFRSEDEHLEFLRSQARLPEGFAVGTRSFNFRPQELPTLDASMTPVPKTVETKSTMMAMAISIAGTSTTVPMTCVAPAPVAAVSKIAPTASTTTETA